MRTPPLLKRRYAVHAQSGANRAVRKLAAVSVR